MRTAIAIALIATATAPVAAASPTWWMDFLHGGQAPSHAHRPAKPSSAKAAPAKTTPAEPPPTVAPPTETPPVPMPRPRPAASPAAVPAPDAAFSAAPKGPPSSTDAAQASPEGAGKTPKMPAPTGSAPAATPPTDATTTPKQSAPRIFQTACPAVIAGQVEAKPLPPITDGQCGEPSPLSVTGVLVNGRMLPLNTPATFGCSMATDLPAWVADVDNYTCSVFNTHIKSVQVGESYVCRLRHTPDGDSSLSEHGRADALDFVGFTLEDGRVLTVTTDYASADPKLSRLMHFAHDAACTRFTTVLGPEANALHHDHFHLDLGCHGKTCTYRLCE